MKKSLLVLIVLFAVSFLISSETLTHDFYVQLNLLRTSNELNPLIVDEQLEEMALHYASLCRKVGYISHDLIPDNGVYSFYHAVAPKYQNVGEVLAFSTTLSSVLALTSWMESKSHREQLMHPDNIAVGFAWVKGYYYVAYTGR